MNPIGVDHGNQETDYGLFTITGILDQNPGKTHLPFQVLTSLETIRALAKDSILNTDFNNWELVWECHNYALLSENNSQVDLQVALDKISKEKFTNVPLFLQSSGTWRNYTGTYGGQYFSCIYS
ncbi:MAG: hypothetical protein IPJ13_02155 [Saprospiraceae bacterium]|nr:hypothetical protein [Saprospiraceae bacterium]